MSLLSPRLKTMPPAKKRGSNSSTPPVRVSRASLAPLGRTVKMSSLAPLVRTKAIDAVGREVGVVVVGAAAGQRMQAAAVGATV